MMSILRRYSTLVLCYVSNDFSAWVNLNTGFVHGIMMMFLCNGQAVAHSFLLEGHQYFKLPTVMLFYWLHIMCRESSLCSNGKNCLIIAFATEVVWIVAQGCPSQWVPLQSTGSDLYGEYNLCRGRCRHKPVWRVVGTLPWSPLKHTLLQLCYIVSSSSQRNDRGVIDDHLKHVGTNSHLQGMNSKINQGAFST